MHPAHANKYHEYLILPLARCVSRNLSDNQSFYYGNFALPLGLVAIFASRVWRTSGFFLSLPLGVDSVPHNFSQGL